MAEVYNKSASMLVAFRRFYGKRPLRGTGGLILTGHLNHLGDGWWVAMVAMMMAMMHGMNTMKRMKRVFSSSRLDYGLEHVVQSIQGPMINFEQSFSAKIHPIVNSIVSREVFTIGVKGLYVKPTSHCPPKDPCSPVTVNAGGDAWTSAGKADLSHQISTLRTLSRSLSGHKSTSTVYIYIYVCVCIYIYIWPREHQILPTYLMVNQLVCLVNRAILRRSFDLRRTTRVL